MKKITMLILLILANTGALQAKEQVEVESRFDIDDVSTIVLNVEVGEVVLDTHQSSEVIVEVLVKESDSHWFSSADLDDIQLNKEISQQRLFLEIDKEDTNQEWKITVPESVNLKVELGVGKIYLSDLNKDIDVELGVGDTEIVLSDNDYARIELDTGVGDAKLKGFSDYHAKRSLVSKSVEWKGNGQHDIRVDVGVGDVRVSVD